MSTYRPKRKPHYLYDFRLEGHRFHGTTRCTNKREAEFYESIKKKEAIEQLKEARALGEGPITFGVAATRYWEEVGQFAKTATEIARTLAWLQAEIGDRKLLAAIDGKAIAALVAKRRLSEGRLSKPVSPATVNRTTEVLRSIILRAERVWGERVAPVEWRKHRLKEPQERVRELRREEEAALFTALRHDYHPIVRFALLTGCRLAECVGLRWEHIDWGGRHIWIRGKGDKLATIPLSPTLRELLWPLREHHREAVFTYEVERGSRDRRKGERHPITYEGLKTVFTRQVKVVVPDYRFHDNRHTAATRILRASGNLRVAQALLRHSSITTTTKYAHVMQDDVMAAMELVAKAGSVTRDPDRCSDQAFPMEAKTL